MEVGGQTEEDMTQSIMRGLKKKDLGVPDSESATQARLTDEKLKNHPRDKGRIQGSEQKCVRRELNPGPSLGKRRS